MFFILPQSSNTRPQILARSDLSSDSVCSYYSIRILLLNVCLRETGMQLSSDGVPTIRSSKVPFAETQYVELSLGTGILRLHLCIVQLSSQNFSVCKKMEDTLYHLTHQRSVTVRSTTSKNVKTLCVSYISHMPCKSCVNISLLATLRCCI